MLAYGSRVPDVQNGGCAGLTKNGSYVWILGLPLVELLGKDLVVRPCWRRCVSGAGLEVSKDSRHSSCVYLFVSHLWIKM